MTQRVKRMVGNCFNSSRRFMQELKKVVIYLFGPAVILMRGQTFGFRPDTCLVIVLFWGLHKHLPVLWEAELPIKLLLKVSIIWECQVLFG